eukprot:15157930-Alexandrium_andersonii.AAC.1
MFCPKLSPRRRRSPAHSTVQPTFSAARTRCKSENSHVAAGGAAQCVRPPAPSTEAWGPSDVSPLF